MYLCNCMFCSKILKRKKILVRQNRDNNGRQAQYRTGIRPKWKQLSHYDTTLFLRRTFILCILAAS